MRLGRPSKEALARATNPGPSPIHQVAVNAFSVPIVDAQGHMMMALSLTTQANRMASDWDGPVPRALADAARELSSRLV